MPHSPKVTIIILNWNGIADTLALLMDLELVKYDNFSVLIVDNASRDDSLGQLARFMEARRGRGKFALALLPLSKNSGFAQGNNKGLLQASRAKPDYYLLLNNDTLVSPDFLTKLVNAAERGQQFAAVAPTIYRATTEGQKSTELWYAGAWINFKAGGAHHKTHKPLSDETTNQPFLSGCCLLIKAKVQKDVSPLFDPLFFAYAEDLDLCLRLQKSGWQLGYVPDAEIWHKLAASSGGPKSSNFWYYNIRNNWLIMMRYAMWYEWPVFILYFLFYKPVLVSLVGAVLRPRRDKGQRLIAIVQATNDALHRRYGPRSGQGG